MPVREYIHHQEEHHRIKTFSEEIDEFMRKYGWEIINVRQGVQSFAVMRLKPSTIDILFPLALANGNEKSKASYNEKTKANDNGKTKDSSKEMTIKWE